MKMPKSEAKLEDILNRTNDWLKFAETKNGAFVALDCAIIFGLCRLFLSFESPSQYLMIYIYLGVLMLLCAVIVGFLSFIPRLTPPWAVKFPTKLNSINIFYFGDICSLTPRTYLDEYYKACNEQGNYTELDIQYSKQIVINSKIAFIKYSQFNIVTWFTISALITPIGAWVLSLVKNKS